MTFPEVIDALIPIYEEGMKAESYDRLKELELHHGICHASIEMFESFIGSALRRYDPNVVTQLYYFEPPWHQHVKNTTISEIIETCIRPRLELLKRIQQDLKKEKS